MIVMVGVGNIGRELLAKLPRDIEVTCIDSNPASRSVVENLRGMERTKMVIGDATSRLVLEEAGVEESEAVLITTTTERISIEVARVLRDHFRPGRTISVGITEKGSKELIELGADVINIFTASANDMRNLIEFQAKTAHGIGIGKKEILEVEVHPSSRLKNKPLGYIAPLRWNIGIIYRDGNIIVPKPETILKEKDRVVVLGDPAVLRTVAELLTTDFQKFPLEYGTALIVYLSGSEGEEIFEEVNYIYSVFQLDRLYMVYSATADRLIAEHDEMVGKQGLRVTEKIVSSLAPEEAIRAVSSEPSALPGVVVLSRQMLTDRVFPFRRGGQRGLLASLIQFSRCPVILARGSFPYERLIVPALADIDFQHQISKAVEIAHTINSQIWASAIKPSQYLASEEDTARFEEVKKIVSNAGFVHRKKIDTRILEGNPIHEVEKILPEYNLLVLGTKGWSRRGFLQTLFSPDIVSRVMARSGISCLLLPAIEESL